MSNITTSFWGMTINNYTDTDLALVQNGYPDHMRELVYTLEVGEEGTPHIQAWIKLQRQQRLSFVKKLFPRASFKPLCNDEYIANTKKYAQKLDETAMSAAVHKFQDPIYTIENVTKRLLEGVAVEVSRSDKVYEDIEDAARRVRKAMVASDYRYAKIFVSSTFKSMWREYAEEMFEYHIKHTHTHTQEENVSLPTINAGETENEDFGEVQSEDIEGREYDGSSDEDCASETSGGYDESGSVSDCTSDVE